MKRIRTGIVFRIVIFAVIALACLLFPTPENYMSSYWMNRFFERPPVVIFVSIRRFVLEPLSWGTLVFALTGCLDKWLIKHGLIVQWSKKRCRILFVIAVVLILPLAYLTYGLVYSVVFPPMPFMAGVYVMSHKWIWDFCWVVVAILLQLSLLGIEIKTE